MPRFVAAVFLLITALLPHEAAAGEDHPQSTMRPIGGLAFAEEYELTVVNIDAYVTDKKGNPVTDLTASDFVVAQDGEPREVTNFQLYTRQIFQQNQLATAPGQPQPTPSPDAADAVPPQPVHVVLFIDNEHLNPLDRNQVLRQATDFVRDTLQPPVQMMVCTYQKSFKVLNPFTGDSDEVLSSLRTIRRQVGGANERENTRIDLEKMMHDTRDRQAPDDAYNGATNQYNHIYRMILSVADEEANDTLFTVDALRSVVTRLAGLPGRKTVIYISNGLPMIAGIDLFYEFAEIFNDNSVMNDTSRYDQSRLLSSLVASANAQGVTFYTLGAQGLDMGRLGSAAVNYAPSPLSTSVAINNVLDSLRYLADGTGGVAIVNTNDFSRGLQRVSQDLFTYYSLGYSISSSGADKLHVISVKLPDHPEYDLRYRKRFVEKSVEGRVQDKVISALMFDVEDNPMDLKLTATRPAPASEGRWTLPVHLSFPLDKVALVPEGDHYVGRLVLFFGARDSQGKQSDLVRREQRVEITAADYQAAKDKAWGIDSTLLLEGGSYKIVAALLDPITRQSSYASLRQIIPSS